jgi:hypothetical protein
VVCRPKVGPLIELDQRRTSGRPIFLVFIDAAKRRCGTVSILALITKLQGDRP